MAEHIDRLFNLVFNNGVVMDLKVLGRYPFPKMWHILEGLAGRLRQQHGNYRDRKMQSFYALQIINGRQHSLNELFLPPFKLSNLTSMPAAA